MTTESLKESPDNVELSFVWRGKGVPAESVFEEIKSRISCNEYVLGAHKLGADGVGIVVRLQCSDVFILDGATRRASWKVKDVFGKLPFKYQRERYQQPATYYIQLRNRVTHSGMFRIQITIQES
jgi:hypothetical protein